MAMRDQGLVNQVFDEQKLRALQGEWRSATSAIRPARTRGRTRSPCGARTGARSRSHNGNLINAVELHGELRAAGVGFRSTSDSR